MKPCAKAPRRRKKQAPIGGVGGREPTRASACYLVSRATESQCAGRTPDMLARTEKFFRPKSKSSDSAKASGFETAFDEARWRKRTAPTPASLTTACRAE